MRRGLRHIGQGEREYDVLGRTERAITRWAKPAVLPLAFASVFAVGALDTITSYEVLLSIFLSRQRVWQRGTSGALLALGSGCCRASRG